MNRRALGWHRIAAVSQTVWCLLALIGAFRDGLLDQIWSDRLFRRMILSRGSVSAPLGITPDDCAIANECSQPRSSTQAENPSGTSGPRALN